MSSKRNGKIDFLRFIFAIVIVIHHSKFLIGANDPLIGGSLAVELYFMISGYLLMASVVKQRKNTTECGHLGSETKSFIVHKAKALYPDMFIAWGIAFIVHILSNPSLGKKGIIKLFLTHFWEMFFTTMSGLGKMGIDGVVWYVSSMLLCMAIMYPLLRRFPDFTENWIIPFTVIVFYGYLFHCFRSPRGGGHWIGLMYKSNIRSWCALGLGVISYRIAERLRRIHFSGIGKTLLAVCEAALYVLTILYMTMKASKMDYFFILLLFFAVTLSFSSQAAGSGKFDRQPFYVLGAYSMPLFLSHTFYAHNLGKFLPSGMSWKQELIVYMACAFLTGLVVMLLSKALRAGWKRWSAGLRKILTVM